MSIDDDKKPLTREEVNKILSKTRKDFLLKTGEDFLSKTREGSKVKEPLPYPADDELARFPLGEQLKTIPKVNDRYEKHIPKVFEGVNILLSDHPHYIVKEWRKSNDPIQENKFTQALIKIFGSQEDGESGILQIPREDFDPFFRLMAMYHDIGKRIIHERHPLVGWHLLKDV